MFVIQRIQRINFYTPTNGTPIKSGNEANAVLLVIDVQNDTTGAGSMYCDNTTDFLNKVNAAVDIAEDNGMEIIYIQQERVTTDDMHVIGESGIEEDNL